MSLLAFSNANIQFDKGLLTWKLYIASEVLCTTKQVELVDKKQFARAAMNENVEVLVIDLAFLSTIYPAREA